MEEAPPSSAEFEGDAAVRATLLDYLHSCPICSHVDLRHYCRVPSRFRPGEFIRYERCTGCGVVLRNPRLPSAHRIAAYAERVLSAEQKTLVPRNQRHYRHMMRVLNRLIPPGGGRRLLDFGCGAGGLLVEARAAGFDVTGLELNRDLARHVEGTYGIRVWQGLLTDSAPAGECFDVIVSSQVFEHLLDPRDTLRRVRRYLNVRGLILIEVPNLLDIRERLRRGATMDDSHLFYFSPRSLGRLLADGGFRVLRLCDGLRPYGLLGNYGERAPLWLLGGAERFLSLCQVKTGLSVIAGPR